MVHGRHIYGRQSRHAATASARVACVKEPRCTEAPSSPVPRADERRAGIDVATALAMDADEVRELTIAVHGRPARVFAGGRGEPMLLVHGGWGGAELHWGGVWGRLVEMFHVIAPDLPGIGRTDQNALASVGDYARWLDALLGALDIPSAWCVGNSFGASVVCRLASDYRTRCRGLVLVNGIPLPSTPPVLRWMGQRPLARRLIRAVQKRVAYSPSALERGFVHPWNVPPELQALVRSESPPQLDAFVDILVHGGSPRPVGLAPLLLWGEGDQLPGTSASAARRLQTSWPGATLTFVPDAGHMPQVENPAAFVGALGSFVEKARRQAA